MACGPACCGVRRRRSARSKAWTPLLDLSQGRPSLFPCSLAHDHPGTTSLRSGSCRDGTCAASTHPTLPGRHDAARIQSRLARPRRSYRHCDAPTCPGTMPRELSSDSRGFPRSYATRGNSELSSHGAPRDTVPGYACGLRVLIRSRGSLPPDIARLRNAERVTSFLHSGTLVGINNP